MVICKPPDRACLLNCTHAELLKKPGERPNTDNADQRTAQRSCCPHFTFNIIIQTPPMLPTRSSSDFFWMDLRMRSMLLL